MLLHEDELNHGAESDDADKVFRREDWHLMFEKELAVLDGDQEILKDVRVLSLPGHTPGTTGVLLELEHTGAVLLTDDAMYTHDTYGPPAVGSPITWDLAHWSGPIEKIRQTATEHNAFLFPG